NQDPVEHLKRVQGPREHRLEVEERLAELDGLPILDVDRADNALDLGLDLVHQLPRLEDAERLAGCDYVADLDERRRTRLRRPVKDADHRRLDSDRPVGRRFVHGRSETQVPGQPSPPPPPPRAAPPGPPRGRLDRRRLLRSAYGHPRALLLHRDFRDAGFLDDAYDFADPLGARLVDAPAEETVLAAR